MIPAQPQKLPAHGRLAGIDFGTVRIGVAVCDPGRMLASPLETYSRKDVSADGDYFRRLASREELVGWVVGLPVHMSGDESEKSRQARQFGEWIGAVSGLPVQFQDERFTTAEANENLAVGGLKGRKAAERRDMLAAQAILARYLESIEPTLPGSIHD